MPKVHGTRRHKANELAGYLARGPSLSLHFCDEARNLSTAQKQAICTALEDRVRLWLDSWVAPRCRDLIPELRTKGVHNVEEV